MYAYTYVWSTHQCKISMYTDDMLVCVSMCMHVGMYVCMHVCHKWFMYVPVVCMCVLIQTCMYDMYVWHVCMISCHGMHAWSTYVCTYACMHACMCAWVCMSVYVLS